MISVIKGHDFGTEKPVLPATFVARDIDSVKKVMLSRKRSREKQWSSLLKEWLLYAHGWVTMTDIQNKINIVYFNCKSNEERIYLPWLCLLLDIRGGYELFLWNHLMVLPSRHAPRQSMTTWLAWWHYVTMMYMGETMGRCTGTPLTFISFCRWSHFNVMY